MLPRVVVNLKLSSPQPTLPCVQLNFAKIFSNFFERRRVMDCIHYADWCKNYIIMPQLYVLQNQFSAELMSAGFMPAGRSIALFADTHVDDKFLFNAAHYETWSSRSRQWCWGVVLLSFALDGRWSVVLQSFVRFLLTWLKVEKEVDYEVVESFFWVWNSEKLFKLSRFLD